MKTTITIDGNEYTIVEIKNSIALVKDTAGKLTYKWIGFLFEGGV